MEVLNRPLEVLNLGAGTGLEVHFWHLSYNLMVGLAGYMNFGRTFKFNLTAESGLYYYF